MNGTVILDMIELIVYQKQNKLLKQHIIQEYLYLQTSILHIIHQKQKHHKH